MTGKNGKISMAIGVAIGLGLAVTASALYGLSGRSTFCGSCHSMAETYARWSASRHKQFSCSECHMPATGFLRQIAYKTRAGLRDLYEETLRGYSAYPVISVEGRQIANENCHRCHRSTIEATGLARGGDCLRCHRDLVHSTAYREGGLPFETKQ